MMGWRFEWTAGKSTEVIELVQLLRCVINTFQVVCELVFWIVAESRFQIQLRAIRFSSLVIGEI